ncbi:MAG TPA: hypothetical protein VIY29_31015, partial [Ktedonobacteraceae bacterium]
AAKAEAVAEASSARTREARYVALQADQALEEVRAAIASGALSGEDARTYLRNAEREATRSQAQLADAEAAEEQALNAAMNAEAEAEVAEGMAFAASDLAGISVEEEVEPEESTQPLANSVEAETHSPLEAAQEEQEEGDDWQGDTLKFPVMPDQEKA